MGLDDPALMDSDPAPFHSDPSLIDSDQALLHLDPSLIDWDPAPIDSEARPCGGRRDRMEACETGWRRARPCGGDATVFIGPKPRGGRGQQL